MLGSMKKIHIKGLEAKAEAVFNVLNAHNVFGKLEGLRMDVERRGFINSITSHATGGDSRHYLELTYPSCVRFIIDTTIPITGEADFRGITAYDHPRKSDRMDYEALNADIHKALNAFALWL